MHNSIFEGLHSVFMFFLPNERCTFACEVDEGVSNGGIILDPDAEECLDV